MNIFKTIGKTAFSILIFILGIVASLALTFGLAIIISMIQTALFAKGDYVLMSAQNFSTRIIFIFEVFFIYMFFYFKYRKAVKELITEMKWTFYIKYKSKIITIISIVFILLIYCMIISVGVFYNDKVIYHSFFKPQGKVYYYSDIKEIDTGFTRKNVPFIQHRGEFYYNIILKDDTKINAAFSGAISTKDDKDIYLTLKELDQIFVKTGAQKTVDSEYFSVGVKNLDKLYSNRIRSILLNMR